MCCSQSQYSVKLELLLLLTLRTHTEHGHTARYHHGTKQYNSSCDMHYGSTRNLNASQGCQCLHYFTPKY